MPTKPVPQRLGLRLCERQDGAGALSEALEPRDFEGEPLVGCLLADPESTADLGPGAPVPAALVDEMAEQGVGGPLQVGHGLRGLRQLDQGIVTRGIGPDAVDELLQGRCGGHASTLTLTASFRQSQVDEDHCPQGMSRTRPKAWRLSM